MNATGVWADELRRLDDPAFGATMRPAKGIHLTVPRDKLPCDLAAVLPVPKDRRTIFVVPWDEHTYIGTTDTEYDGPLDDPRVEPEDVAYVLRAVNAAVSSPLTPEDVSATWAGLRPLLATSSVRGHAPSARTADLSRRHQVQRSRSGLVSITGGKLTTYRKMAADTVDAVERELGSVPGRCRTKQLRLRGSEGLVAPRARELAAEFGVDAEVLDALRRRYGGEASAVLGLTVDRPELRAPLVPGLTHLEAEVVYAARYEMATCVEDVLSRRTRALLLDARSSAAAASRTAELLAAELGWDPSRTLDESKKVQPHRAARSRRNTVACRAAVLADAEACATMTGNHMPSPPPIELNGDVRERLGGERVALDDRFLERLAGECAIVDSSPAALAESGRDWWPISLRWALSGAVPARPGVVARPADTGEVAGVLRCCNEAGIPVTAAGGRSGVCGGAVPVFGGVSLDCCGLFGVQEINADGSLVDVRAGTFGDALEDELGSGHGITIGHWPQSVELATVGGWIACRGAGQYSTRYGKIEDIVAGLEVVLADGTVVRTGCSGRSRGRAALRHGPRPDRSIRGQRGNPRRPHRGQAPGAPLELPRSGGRRGPSRALPDGLEALRRTLRRGATPAVVRLYDAVESKRHFDTAGEHVLIALDEGDGAIVEATMAVLEEECRSAAPLEVGVVEQWFAAATTCPLSSPSPGPGWSSTRSRSPLRGPRSRPSTTAPWRRSPTHPGSSQLRPTSPTPTWREHACTSPSRASAPIRQTTPGRRTSTGIAGGRSSSPPWPTAVRSAIITASDWCAALTSRTHSAPASACCRSSRTRSILKVS